jgi:DNA-binding response OmpR family regulator
MSPTILVVDDDPTLTNLIELSLTRLGYKVHLANNGYDALEALSANAIDLVLLDVLMPQMDGFAVCAAIRKSSQVPIILVTALGQTDDVVRGFQLGIDDFVTKPFFFRELLARMKAVLRRQSTNERAQAQRLPAPFPIVLNPESSTYEVKVNGKPVSLTKLEFELLRYLMEHAGQVVSKTDLLKDVWAYAQHGDPNIVEVGILRLRNKIEQNPSSPVYLRTVRGVGYQFSVPVHSSKDKDHDVIS